MLDLSSSTTLYSNANCTCGRSCDLFSHALRLIIQHKGLTITQENALPDSLKHIPLPAFIHNKFLVYGHATLIEFLCERFPDPASLPLDPTNRAIHRMVIDRILTDWYSPFNTKLIEEINNSTGAFEDTRYFLSKSIGLIDCILAPLMWTVQDNPLLHKRFSQYAKDLEDFFRVDAPSTPLVTNLPEDPFMELT